MKVLLIEAQTLLRESLREHISKWNAKAVIDDYSSPEEIESKLPSENYNLIIFKIVNPNINNLNVITRFNRLAPMSPLICLTDVNDHSLIQQMIHLGSKGVITSSASSSEFIAVLQLVIAGGTFLPSEIINSQCKLINTEYEQDLSLSGEHRISDFIVNFGLSERQSEVVQHLCEGRSNKVISNMMGLSINTVKAHLSAIFKTLEVRNRTEVVALVARESTQPQELSQSLTPSAAALRAQR